jgi:hypothetical protein
MAYLNGQIESAIPVPDAVLRALPPSPNTVLSGRPAPPPLLIQSVTHSETEFLTDRGPRRLPAWRLHAADVLGAIWVLDPDVDPPEWQPPEPPAAPRPALQSHPTTLRSRRDRPDKATLTVHFMGALPEYERYPRAEVIESAHAVAIVPAGQDIGPPGIRILPGHMHQITVRLSHPLGARVFVDLHGNAGQVLPQTAEDHPRSSRESAPAPAWLSHPG